MSVVDISPSGDGGLTLKLSYPPAALEAYKAISDEPPEPLRGFTIRMTGDEQSTVSDGQVPLQHRLWRDPVGTTMRRAALRFTTRICGNGSIL